MKLLITQRESVDGYGAPIDSLEATYTVYFAELGAQMQPVPNFLPDPEAAFAGEKFDALVLTGGGSLPPEFYRVPHRDRLQSDRDRTEKALVGLCRKQGKPILGICRGMQYLNALWGGKISKLDTLPVPRPIQEDHPVEIFGESWLVNQYHNDGVYLSDLASAFVPLAIDRENNVVEGFWSETEKILAFQWHPERPFSDLEAREKTKKLIERFLATGGVSG